MKLLHPVNKRLESGFDLKGNVMFIKSPIHGKPIYYNKKFVSNDISFKNLSLFLQTRWKQEMQYTPTLLMLLLV